MDEQKEVRNDKKWTNWLKDIIPQMVLSMVLCLKHWILLYHSGSNLNFSCLLEIITNSVILIIFLFFLEYCLSSIEMWHFSKWNFCRVSIVILVFYVIFWKLLVGKYVKLMYIALHFPDGFWMIQ
jgi:hypothetical protein